MATIAPIGFAVPGSSQFGGEWGNATAIKEMDTVILRGSVDLHNVGFATKGLVGMLSGGYHPRFSDSYLVLTDKGPRRLDVLQDGSIVFHPAVANEVIGWISFAGISFSTIY